MIFKKWRGNSNFHTGNGKRYEEDSLPTSYENREIFSLENPLPRSEDDFELMSERSLKRIQRQLEAKITVFELGTRWVETKQRLSLTALQAAADTRLQRLQIAAHVAQTEAALLEQLEQANAKLRHLKLAKLANEVGIPVERLENLLAANHAQENHQENLLDEEEI